MGKQINLKPMKYMAKHTFDVLADDTYKGYRFFIISYGTHPCAYVALPKTSKFYGKNYEDEIFDDLNFHVHGGLSYSGWSLHGRLKKEAYAIGWDYVHPGDYYELSPTLFLGKKWSTVEVYEEVKEAIDEIIKEEVAND